MGKRRPSDDGMVRKREDGHWEGRVVVGYDEKGRPKTKNVLAKTKSECSAKLNALKASLQGPSEPKQRKPNADMTFGAWLDRWYQRECKPHIRPKTQADYENRIYQHIIPELGAITGTEPPQEKELKPPSRTAFQPVKGKYHKPGTGCISQINDHLWEGRYSPKINRRRMSRNVYAKTEAECEEKLAELIREMKAEIAAGKERQKQGGLTS